MLPKLNQRRSCWALAICSAIALLGDAQSTAHAAAPRVLPADKQPADARLGDLRHLNSYFPFVPPKTPEAWAKRSELVRRRVMVATGMWPIPTKTPVKAVIHGRVERGDYTVEKVYLESFPGFYVTGSLYRPKGKQGKLPAVLCPHGHWGGGRFHDHGAAKVAQEIKSGAEKYPVGGRHPLQARCVQLARMGCIVFHYDMIGYADSVQLSYQLAHRFAKQRDGLSQPNRWGLFSAQAELRQQSIFGLQTLNSVRALDWISSLPDVDPKRIAVTGASGGGTQTFILSAIDPRLAVSFPAVMVSTAMQGGCTCENCSFLRIDTGNIELAGLFAPRPLALSAANDWTKYLETKGLPELKQLYKMLGVPKLVDGRHFDFGHNYNYVSRAMMYGWLNRHLNLGHKEPIIERDFTPLSVEEMSVWNKKHPKPTGGEAYEVSLTKRMDAASKKQIAGLTPSDSASLAKYRQVIGGAVDIMVGRGLPPAGAIGQKKLTEVDRGSYLEYTFLVNNKQHGEQLPVVFLFPKKWNREVVIWIHEDGKNGLFNKDGSPKPEVNKLLEGGMTVVAADLLYQGEFLTGGKPLDHMRRVGNPREYAGYTLGYNHSLFAQRTHDILTLISHVKHHKDKSDKLHLIGLGAAGAWVAAARAQAGGAVDRAAIDITGVDFSKMTDVRDVNLLPGAIKYGGLPAMLSLGAPHETWIASPEPRGPKLTRAAYQASGKADALTAHAGPKETRAAIAVEWLLK
jgi:dienelactone hydrolase